MKKPGRRQAGANTRLMLLNAVAELTEERGMAPVSIRDISEKSDINQAMIRYHFGDKDGLMCASLDHGFKQLFDAVPQGGGFEETVGAMAGWVQNNGWLIILMMQFVYAGTELRNHFETEHAPKLARLYIGALENGRAAGDVRDDLDPGFATTALISLLVFPTLARPILGRVLGKTGTHQDPDATTHQILKLFAPKGLADD